MTHRDYTDIRLYDENNVPYGVKHIGNKPRVSAMPYLYDIAEGNVPDHSAIYRHGHNTAVGVTWETVHAPSSLRTYLTAAERLQIASSDADDDGDPAGNGARTVQITGLDSSYDALTETVTLNGTTNVLTTASFLRVFTLEVITAGTTGYNEGVITASNNADTIVIEQINVQENKSDYAGYTVPNGYTAYITDARATEASTKGSEFGLWKKPEGGLWALQQDIVLLDAAIVVPFSIPIPLQAKTDVEIRAKGVIAGANVTAGFDGWIEVT